MDGLTMKAGLVIGALLLIGLLWLVWKFFAKVFKHVVIVLVISVLGSVLFVYLRYGSSSPRPNSSIGKHAYMKETGSYLGMVEAEGQDNQRGQVWIIRPPGGYPQKYSKRRVMLKDKMEFKPESTPTPAPTPESKPPSDKKVDKKVNINKKRN
jgi:hypothetical protein